MKKHQEKALRTSLHQWNSIQFRTVVLAGMSTKDLIISLYEAVGHLCSLPHNPLQNEKQFSQFKQLVRAFISNNLTETDFKLFVTLWTEDPATFYGMTFCPFVSEIEKRKEHISNAVSHYSNIFASPQIKRQGQDLGGFSVSSQNVTPIDKNRSVSQMSVPDHLHLD